MMWRLGQPPRLHTERHNPEEERKVSWLELFYDLIYVATIIQLGTRLSDDVSALGALLFVLLFVPVWWAWTGMMFYFNRFVVDDVWHRTLLFVQMFAIGNMAISVTGAFGDASRDFALSYFVVRVVLVAFYIRAWRHVPRARPLIRRYAVGFGLASSIWLASAFVPEPYRFGLWVVALVSEFYVPVSAASRRLHSLLEPDEPHMMERYGLLTIIVLGESFIKVVDGLSGQGIALSSLALSGLGFAIIASLWWLYFDSVAGSAIKRTASAPYVWIYTHLPLTMGITALGVSTKKISLLDMTAPLPERYRWLVCGAVAGCLISLALLTRASQTGPRLGSGGRFFAYMGAAALVLVMVPLGAYLSAIAVVSGVGVLCIGQVLIDLALGRHEYARVPSEETAQ